jgi:hypothetical protein
MGSSVSPPPGAGSITPPLPQLEQRLQEFAHRLARFLGGRWIAADMGIERDAGVNSGDGMSPETAFVVIAVDEEYSVLETASLTPVKQALVNHGGSAFDRFEVKLPESDQPVTLFSTSTARTRNWRERYRRSSRRSRDSGGLFA